MKKTTIIISALIILISFIVGVYLYPQMPEQMASHWGIDGEVDGWMPKIFVLFLMPAIGALLFALFYFLPKIDPLKKNVEKFRKHYDGFVLMMLLFLFYIYALSLLWNYEIRFDMGTAIIPALVALFYFIGILLKNAKRNWFIGIRTPWTLSDDKVWEKTHKLASKLFKISAIIILFSLFFKEYSLWVVLVVGLGTALYSIIYSYWIFRK